MGNGPAASRGDISNAPLDFPGRRDPLRGRRRRKNHSLWKFAPRIPYEAPHAYFSEFGKVAGQPWRRLVPRLRAIPLRRTATPGMPGQPIGRTLYKEDDMTADPKTAFAPEARRPDPDPVAHVGTRASALAALVADPEVRKGVGAAWPLYVALVAGWGGEVAGTRDEIGERLGEDGRNVGNWVERLAKAGIAAAARDRRRMKVELLGEHMEVARMPVTVTVADDEHEDEPKLDEKQRGVLSLVDDARAMGGKLRITVEVDA